VSQAAEPVLEIFDDLIKDNGTREEKTAWESGRGELKAFIESDIELVVRSTVGEEAIEASPLTIPGALLPSNQEPTEFEPPDKNEFGLIHFDLNLDFDAPTVKESLKLTRKLIDGIKTIT
jgi:hypothetical protein